MLAARRPSFRSGHLWLRTSPAPRHASLLVRIALTRLRMEDDGGQHAPVRQTRHETRNCAYLPRAQTRRALRTVVPFETSPQPRRRRRAPLLPPAKRSSCGRPLRLLGCLPPAILPALASRPPSVSVDLVVRGSISRTCSALIWVSSQVSSSCTAHLVGTDASLRIGGEGQWCRVWDRRVGEKRRRCTAGDSTGTGS